MPVLSTEEFAEKYKNYCGYWAKHFLQKENRPYQQADVEDLAARAEVQLMKCPERHRQEHRYVTKLIIRAVIDGLRRERRPILSREMQAPILQDSTDFFDTLEGRDGLAEATQISCDSQKVQAVFHTLKASDRIVIQLAYGLTGLRPLTCRRIGTRLGRTEAWAQRRMLSGITQIRQHLKIR